MAIIYSYPTVTPSADDLLLGTDATAADKATKNFTVQSIVDIVSGGAAGLGAVLAISSDASDPTTGLNQSASNFLNVQGTGTFTAGILTDGTLQIAGGNLTTTGDGTFADITGTLLTVAQPNITSVGTLTSLSVNTSVTGTAVVTTLTAPGDNLKIASTKAIVDYVGTNPPGAESLAATLAVGELSGGAKDIVMQGAVANITFEDSATVNQGRIVMGASDDLEIYHIGGAVNKSRISNNPLATGIEIRSNTSVDLMRDTNTEYMAKFIPEAAVELYYDNVKKFETLVGGGKVTGAFEATTSGTFASLVNAGTYTAGNGVGAAGQILKSGGVGAATTWATEVPLYTWSYEGTTIPSATAMTVSDGTNITTTWTPGTFNLEIATTGVPDGSGAANQVTFWTDTDTIDGASGFTFAGGASGKVTVAGELEAATLSDGTFSGTAGTYTGGVSIESDTFTGTTTPIGFIGNATTASALLNAGTIQLDPGAGFTLGVGSDAVTYTSGTNITLTTTLTEATVTGKRLQGLTVPTTGNSIEPDDTILSAFGKLQAQHSTQVNGLRFMGAWDARTAAEGGLAGDKGNPQLDSGGGVVVTGTNTSVVADQLVDSTKDFTSEGVTAGERVYNQAGAFTTVTTTPTGTPQDFLVLDEDIFLTNGQTYSVDNDPAINQGEYYVVSNEGTVTLNTINTWKVGDWVMAGATNVWEKLDGPGVEGTGSVGRLPRWDTVNTLNDSIVLQTGTGIDIDSNKNFRTQGTGTITSAALLTASANFALTGGINLPTGYGGAGQVLTTNPGGGGAGTDMVWTTPTTGTVESVTASDGILIGGTAIDPTVGIRYLDSDASGTIKNAIEIAPSGTPIASDLVWFSDADATSNINAIKNAAISSLPLDNYVDWKLQGDSGTNQDITKQTVVDFAGGTYITTDTTTDTLNIVHDATSRTSNTDTSLPAFGANIDVFDDVQTNGTGHVTVTNLKTITLPSPVNFTAGTAPGAGTPAAGTAGYVPAPAAGTGSASYFLNGIGGFTIPPDLKGVETVNTTSPIGGGGSTATVTITHDASGVAAGTYDSVTVDVKGHVTAGTNPSGKLEATIEIASTDMSTSTWTDMFKITADQGEAVMSTLLATGALYGSVTKAQAASFHVVQAGGTAGTTTANTPISNKIIDTGPGSAGGFELRFTAYGGGGNTFGYLCEAKSVTAVTDLTIVVQVSKAPSGFPTITDETP